MKRNPTLAAALLGAVILAAGNLAQAQTTNFFVDRFDPSGQGTNIYSSGMITNVWGNWFGSAWQSNVWDSASDSSNNPASGSMKIVASFAPGIDQFVVFNGFNGFVPGVNALQWTNLQCDVRFDPGSATSVNGGVTNFGHLEFGTGTPTFGQTYFGGVDAVTSVYTNWTHVSIPISAIINPDFTNIYTLIIHIYGPYYTPALAGNTTLWIDNIKFVGRTNLATTERPIVAPLQKATHALRFFAGDTSATYMRENIATAYDSMSWIDGGMFGFPFTYAITVANFPDKVYQGYEYHMFLVPLNYLRYGAYDNSFVDYDATNLMSLRIVANTTNYVGILSYKVNSPSGNANLPLATIGSTTVAGQWKVTFNDNVSGTLTYGTNSASFTMPAPDAATFADPLVAYFGIQANNTNAYWQSTDISQITISNTVIDDNFSSPVIFNLDTGNWTVVASIPSCIWEAMPGARSWMNWTVPEDTYTPVVSTNLHAGSPGWLDPAVYNGNIPVVSALIGDQRWALILSNNVPAGKSAFFAVRKPLQ